MNIVFFLLLAALGWAEGSTFSTAKRQDLLFYHNEFRKGVGGANVFHMEWDGTLQAHADWWTEQCESGHGFPDLPSGHAYKGMGQNMWSGNSIADVEGPVSSWYGEVKDYEFSHDICCEDCGHYKQVVKDWAYSVGCAWADCSGKIKIGCNYLLAGNYKVQPYIPGTACSLCEGDNGGWCYEGLCASSSWCASAGITCECPLFCKNGGTKNAGSCTCDCFDGWGGLDCSIACEDTAEGTCTCKALINWQNCPVKCAKCTPISSTSTTVCSGQLCFNRGYLNENCECECAKGYSGKDCSKYSPWELNEL